MIWCPDCGLNHDPLTDCCLQLLRRAMDAGEVGVDADGPPLVLFDPRTNSVGWTGFDWDELPEPAKEEAARRWLRVLASRAATGGAAASG